MYRLTRSNVGPWGLSRLTERRPMYLSPAISVSSSLAGPVAESLTAALRQIEGEDDVPSASADLARLFPAPVRADPVAELNRSEPGRAGRGLFGSSDVSALAIRSTAAASLLTQRPARPAAETTGGHHD